MVSEFAEGGITMGNVEGIVALVIGIAAVFFIPALIWITVITGLIQIVREKVRDSRLAEAEPLREAEERIRRTSPTKVSLSVKPTVEEGARPWQCKRWLLW
jgi:hypothetical protein